MKNKIRKISPIIVALLVFVSIFSVTSIEASATTGQDIAKYAAKFIGTPYKRGGTTPSGFDCSGLTQYVYKNKAGINIGRTTGDQVKAGKKISQAQLKPGDLVFPSSGHVGIYVGNGQMIHSPKPGDKVKKASVYAFYTARRIL